MNSAFCLRPRSLSANLRQRAVAWLLHPLHPQRTRRPDPSRVRWIVREVARQPLLQRWLLTAAGQSPRARQALLARAMTVFRLEASNETAAEIIEQLGDDRLLDAVVEALFRHGGMEPPPLGSSRTAQVRLSELCERLETREVACAG